MIECIRTAARDSKTERIKVSCLDIIVTTTGKAPYYEIKYKEIGEDVYHVGYGSYKLENVLAWRDECFEIMTSPQTNFLRLPCKVGDKVYQISENFIEPCTVETIFLGNYRDRSGNWCNMAEIHYDRDDCPYVSTEIYFTDIGETVFLTETEAEAKLKETEGESDVL